MSYEFQDITKLFLFTDPVDEKNPSALLSDFGRLYFGLIDSLEGSVTVDVQSLVVAKVN
jgi:hypothetical protein